MKPKRKNDEPNLFTRHGFTIILLGVLLVMFLMYCVVMLALGLFGELTPEETLQSFGMALVIFGGFALVGIPAAMIFEWLLAKYD